MVIGAVHTQLPTHPGTHRLCQVAQDADILQDLLRDGVGAVELQHHVAGEHMLDHEHIVLGVLLCQPHWLTALEHLAKLGQLTAAGAGIHAQPEQQHSCL